MDTEQTVEHEQEVQLELFEKPKPVIKVLDEDDGEYQFDIARTSINSILSLYIISIVGLL